ncbi:MAG TPA: glycerate kinase [Thermosynechococcaceae cyanobacterium]
MDLGVLQGLATGEKLKPEVERSSAAQLLADPARAAALGLTPQNVEVAVQRQVSLLQQVYPALAGISQTFGSSGLETAWTLWLPLALQLHDRKQTLEQPLVQGILGGQGTGKTTLSRILTLLLRSLGDTTVSLSIDDLYKTYAERQHLQTLDPRLRWRGPPGTHDVALGLRVLEELRQGQAALPRFDKSLHNGAGDRVASEPVAGIDIVLFEGWFVGAQPVDPQVFDNPPEPIVTAADRSFACDINANLREYLPLWEQLDSLLVLCPEDYRYSKEWRRQAEQEMKALGKPGMSDAEVDAFVEYFWKALHPDLFIQPLVATPAADFVIEIDRHHRPGAMYRGGKREA